MLHKNKLGFLSVFLVLLLTISAFALSENFDLSSTTLTPVACSHSTTVNSITVRNIGDIESSYTLTAEGSAAEFTTYSNSLFTIKPGELKTVFVYSTPGDRKGNYGLETTITTNLGITKTIKHSIEVKNCANINVDVKTPLARTNPCEASQFSFIIKNTGDYSETYDFTASELERYITFSTPSIFLQPNEQKQVDFFVNPACEIYGEQKITFKAFARTSQFLAEVPVLLDIVRAYDYDVAVPASITICNSKVSEIPIAVANKAPFANQYDIDVNGPSWLKTAAKRVELSSKSSGTTALFAGPENPGKYLADVIFKSLRGDVVKAGTTEIIVDNCYDADVNIENPADIIVQGHSAAYPITIKNEGSKQDTYEFELNAPGFVSSNLGKTTLNPGESKIFTLTANANETGDFTATINAHSLETDVITKDIIKLKVISAEQAYKLTITPKNTRVLYGDGQIDVKLANDGTLPATYALTFNGPAYVKLTAQTITLEPGQKQYVALQTATSDKNEQGDYEAQVTGTVKNEIGFVSTFVIKLRQLTVAQELYVFAIANWILLVIIATIIAILIFIAVFGKRIARAYRLGRIKAAEIKKFKAALKAQKLEEQRAKKLLAQSMKNQAKESKKGPNVFFGIASVIFALLLIGGIYFVMAGYVPFISEFFKQQAPEQKFIPIIQVDTAGLEAYGNTVIVRGEKVEIPVIIKNSYNDDLLFDVEVSDASWIRTNTKEVELEAGEQETIIITVTPDETIKGLYVIKVSAELKKDNKIFNEDITLNVRQKNIWQDMLSYVWYVAGAIVILAAVLFFNKKNRKLPVKESKQKEEKAEIIKPARKININVPSKK